MGLIFFFFLASREDTSFPLKLNPASFVVVVVCFSSDILFLRLLPTPLSLSPDVDVDVDVGVDVDVDVDTDVDVDGDVDVDVDGQGTVRWVCLTGSGPSLVIHMANRYGIHPLQVRAYVAFTVSAVSYDSEGVNFGSIVIVVRRSEVSICFEGFIVFF